MSHPEAIVSGLFMELVRVGTTMLVSAMKLVTSEVTSPGTPSETVVARTAELVSQDLCLLRVLCLIHYGKHWELSREQLSWSLQDE